MKTVLHSVQKLLVRLHACIHQLRPSECVALVQTSELRNTSVSISASSVFEDQVSKFMNLNLLVHRDAEIFSVHEQSGYRYRVFHTRLYGCGIR